MIGLKEGNDVLITQGNNASRLAAVIYCDQKLGRILFVDIGGF
jgi:hypothetical protein